MDIVIPLGKGSQHDNRELMYTLRGIERFYPEVGNVFIIAPECPSFLKDIIHIPMGDTGNKAFKQRNICRKLLLACVDPRVSDSFIWFSDDHFLLKDFTPDYNYRGDLAESIARFTDHQSYKKTLVNTSHILNGGMDYGHGPMEINKELFTKAICSVDWNFLWGYAIKSLYCGLNNLTGWKFPDMKIKEPLSERAIKSLLRGRPYFSVDDRGLNEDMWKVLAELYPLKSKYESTLHQPV